MVLNELALFSGVGMLSEGVRAGLVHMGIETRTVCHVEREAYAASVLVARMQEGSIPQAPIWSDVCTFDATAWRGKVDIVVGGFPCTDLSVAGKRAGLDGARSGLFFEIPRIAADCGAWLMLLENVAGIATATASVVDTEEGELDERAASRVVGELADLGWNAEWIVISASDVGASHGRARWFCVAWKLDNSDSYGTQRTGGAQQGAESGCEELGNTQHAGRNAAKIRSGAAQGNDGDAGGKIGSCESARPSSSDGQMGNTESEREVRAADEQRRSGASGCAGEHMGEKEKLDNPISIGRGARRMPDGEHDGDIATAASEVVVVNPSSEGLQERGLSGERELPAEAGSWLHDRFELSGAQLDDSCGARSASGIPRQNTRKEGNSSIAIHCGDGHQLADTDCARLEGIECGRMSDSSGGAAEWIN